MSSYQEFLSKKHIRHQPVGFSVDDSDINPFLFTWQRDVVRWSLNNGRSALFENCGLGKTVQQLEWARLVAESEGRPVLIVAPLAVNIQTRREGEFIGLDVRPCRKQGDVGPGVNVCNYEMIQHFDPSAFAGVVLDESSILKAFMGKTRRMLVEMFQTVPFRLCCTATPAPNDLCELGNHSEFLGLFSLQEMQSRWFVNDGYDAGTHRLKRHAEGDFWRWVASWAVAIQTPADIGYDATGYNLPPLRTITHIVDVDDDATAKGMLVDVTGISATDLHQELRKSAPARAERTADLVNGNGEAWLIWCHTDYEADEITRRIPDAVEVRGSMPSDRKSQALADFSDGKTRVMVTKPKIAGWGMNWQHCAHMVTMSPSYSFESRYQAVRRCWRFGQIRPVEDHVVMARREAKIFEAAEAKAVQHNSMAEAIRKVGHELSKAQRRELRDYNPSTPMQLPSFIQERANAV